MFVVLELAAVVDVEEHLLAVHTLAVLLQQAYLEW
jgi:hypothetical protein